MSAYRVEYVKVTGWDDEVVGLWLAESAEWLLLRLVPVDYVVDGYVLVAKRHIESRGPRRKNNRLERVLELKEIETTPPPGLALAGASTAELLKWVESEYEMVHFSDEDEGSAFFGWVRNATATKFHLEDLAPTGKVDRQCQLTFAFADLRLIAFESDYFNSLKLLWKDGLRPRRQISRNV